MVTLRRYFFKVLVLVYSGNMLSGPHVEDRLAYCLADKNKVEVELEMLTQQLFVLVHLAYARRPKACADMTQDEFARAVEKVRSDFLLQQMMLQQKLVRIHAYLDDASDNTA